MNYIPGFSNYLETSMPRYAKGGPARFAEDVMYLDDGGYEAEPYVDPYQYAPAVQPMTQEAEAPAAAPYSLSGLTPEALAGLYALSANNTGGTAGGIGGLPSIGNLGANYVDTSGAQLITAPTSNKGNATAYGANNQFYVQPNEFVRVVDRSTNSVIFEGVGPDAAREAVKIGQNLTDTLGRKADYQIQAGLTQDNYQPVANEKYNKSDLSKIANVAGTVLPLAMMAVPGLNVAAGKLLGSQLLGSIALGAGTGGLSAGLKGDNILKGAALGGITAAGGALIPKIPAIGDLGNLAKPIGVGIGATAGGLATGQNLQNSLLGGVASGALAYAAPSIQRELGIGQGPNVSAGSTGANAASGPAPIATVTGNTGFSAPVSIGSGGSSKQIDVTGTKLIPSTNVNIGGSGTGALSTVTDTTAKDDDTKTDDDKKEIDVTGTKLIPGGNVNVGGGGTGALSTVTDTTKTDDTKTDDDKKPIDVTGTKTTPGTTVIVGDTTKTDDTKKGDDTEKDDKKKLGVKDYIDIAALLAGLIPGGGGNGGSGGRIPAGMGSLGSVFGKQLPPSTLPRGGALPASTLAAQGLRSPQDYYRYGYGPEQSFFGYATQGAPNTSRAYTGYEGTTAEDAFAAQPMRAPQITVPQQITTPIPNNPAEPIMASKHQTGFARGGFAVEGAGDGRDDKIPALLSDGEYVIDAETVALLGNGSNKAGAKLLDSFRVKVRKQKGKKLARGKFSDNAKRPEQYMAGGPA